jgi:hypothetical protein
MRCFFLIVVQQTLNGAQVQEWHSVFSFYKKLTWFQRELLAVRAARHGSLHALVGLGLCADGAEKRESILALLCLVRRQYPQLHRRHVARQLESKEPRKSPWESAVGRTVGWRGRHRSALD